MLIFILFTNDSGHLHLTSAPLFIIWAPTVGPSLRVSVLGLKFKTLISCAHHLKLNICKSAFLRELIMIC